MRNTDLRVSSDAPVCLATVLEYLISEITELAGFVCKSKKKKILTTRHIELSVRNDPEFSKLLQN